MGSGHWAVWSDDMARGTGCCWAVVGIRPPTSLNEGRGKESDVADMETVGRW